MKSPIENPYDYYVIENPYDYYVVDKTYDDLEEEEVMTWIGLWTVIIVFLKLIGYISISWFWIFFPMLVLGVLSFIWGYFD